MDEIAAAWHAAAVGEVLGSLESDPIQGLSSAAAAARLSADGPNALPHTPPRSMAALLVAQLRSVVVWVLLGAALVSAALGEAIDAVAILAIVVLDAAIGVLQESRAERAVAALARMTAPRARVVRDGHARVVPAADVVRGDLLLLDAGDLVAADARLLDCAALRVVEAALTGESAPVTKRATACPADAVLAERTDMVFQGTSVAAGTGRALVVATGAATELGAIAALLETATPGATPLQAELDRLGRRLVWACLGIVAVVVLLGFGRGRGWLELFMDGVSLAVAAIPEGLPAVVTVALALGVQRMARRNALVRRLPSVETLGCATVVCTDKTGTLTTGDMTVRKIVTGDRVVSVTGDGYGPDGAFFDGEAATPLRPDGPLNALLWVAAGCNDAEIVVRDGRAVAVGDPTEAALLAAASKGGVTRAMVDAAEPRIATLPFDPERKRMCVVRRTSDASVVAAVKGAPEVVLDRCVRLRTIEGDVAFDAPARARLVEACAVLASDGLRVLALAERRLPPDPLLDEADLDLTLLGLVGMQDPPRPGVRDAVARCRLAGVRTVMITGDHVATAGAIAREIGILGPGERVMAGPELDAVGDDVLAAVVPTVSVFARVTAAHKLRLVRAWKTRGAVVAMTGDGVNDAPALREASIGIAMGLTGTEVTKEAADLVLADDDFGTIVEAIEAGRGIYDNVAKTLGYLLAGNVGELLVVLVAAVLGWPLPLLPIQLLWINLVTDGLPALGLATDPVDGDVLARPPRDVRKSMFDARLAARTIGTGLLTAGVALTAFAWHLEAGVAEARTAAFSVIVFEELLRAFPARSATRTVWEIGVLSNLRLLAIVAASAALQALIVHLPVLQPVFGISAMGPSELVEWLALAAIPATVLELAKMAARSGRVTAPS